VVAICHELPAWPAAMAQMEQTHLLASALLRVPCPSRYALAGLKIRDQRTPQVGSSCFENSASDFSQFSLASEATTPALAAVPSRTCWFSLA
jgi:hypothetical protein